MAGGETVTVELGLGLQDVNAGGDGHTIQDAVSRAPCAFSLEPVRSRPVPKVHFLNEQIEVEVPAGTTVLGAAERAGVMVHRGFWSRLHCRGLGLCGSCKVWAMPPQGLGPTGWRERIRYTIRGALRLSCLARVQGDVDVRTKPAGPAPERTLSAYTTFTPPRTVSPPPPAPKPAPVQPAPKADAKTP